MGKIEIESQIGFKEYMKLMYAQTYRKPIMIGITVVGVFLLFLSVWNVIVFDKWEEIPNRMLIFGFALSVLLPLSIYWIAKRNFNSDPRIGEKMIYSFDIEQFHILGESFNSSMTWDKVYKIQEMKNWILIYHNKMIASLIPRPSFSDEEYLKFREIISKHPNLESNLKKVK